MAALVRIHPELASREHLFLETLDTNGNAEYKRVLAQTREQYFDQLNEAEGNSGFQQLEISFNDQAERAAAAQNSGK